MKPSSRLALAAVAAFSFAAADAAAQGCPRGGYPPPFRPTGVVTKGPSPSPTPGVTPIPKSPNDPTPRPGGGGGTTKGVGRPLPGVTRGGTPLKSTGSFDWSAWWDANQWRYLEFRAIAGETDRKSAGDDASMHLTPETIDGIVAALRTAAESSDAFVASEALAALAAVAGRGAAGEIDAAAKTSGRARLAGIRAASRMPAGGGAFESLREMVESRAVAPAERGAAAVVLSVLGGAMPSFDLLSRLAIDREEAPEVRSGAALALALSCGHGGLDVLAKIVTDEKEPPTMRAAAAFALGRTGDRCAVAPLATALADPESAEPLRRAAASSLGAVAVRQEHPLDGEARREAVDTLIGAVRHDDRLAVRGLAILALGQVGSADGKMECRRVLVEGPAELVAPALLALGLLGDGADGEIVSPWLGSEDASYRSAAALACGLVRHAPAMPAIRALLESARDPLTVRSAALAAGLLGDSAAIPLLEKRVESPAGVGDAALVGLGLMGHVSARAAVRRAADEARDIRTRSAAFEVLGRMRDPGSPKRLEAVLAATSRASTERAAAARALGLLGSPATTLPPLEDVMIDRDPELKTPLVTTLVAAAN